MSGISRAIAEGNQFALLDEDVSDLHSSAISPPPPSPSSERRMKASISDVVDCIDNTTTSVRCNLPFGKMKVLLSDVFSMWSSERLSNSRAFTDKDERVEFIASCLQELMVTLMTLQKTLSPAEMMAYAYEPIVITQEARVPVDNYDIHDVDFVKVYGALQFRLKSYLHSLKEPKTKGEIKKHHDLMNLSHKMRETKSNLYEMLDLMDQNRTAAREAFYERKAQKIQEKKKAEHDDIAADVRYGMSKRDAAMALSAPTSKHAAHQQVIAEKKEKRAKEKAQKEKAEKAQKAVTK